MLSTDGYIFESERRENRKDRQKTKTEEKKSDTVGFLDDFPRKLGPIILALFSY